MTRTRLNQLCAILPLICSAAAFVIVMINIAVGVPPKPDEDLSAHLWQLLMAAQIPLVLLFVATADWRRRPSVFLVTAQLFGIAIACLPVWLAGY